jgi:hypothetical protein
MGVGGRAHGTEDAMTRKTVRELWMALCCMILCGALVLAAGCKISKEGSGENERVRVEAPGASVKVDTGVMANDSGMPLYPGAKEKKNAGDEKNRADVNLNTPILKLRVVTLKFTSDDSPEKILAFYKNKLSSYGTVLECKGGGGQDVDMGSGRGLDSPVTCSKERNRSDEISLKVGTTGNQHLVQVKPSGNGSEFSLIYVHMGGKKSDDDYSGRQPS